MPPFQTASLLILWDTIAEYLIMPDRILIYSYTITGVMKAFFFAFIIFKMTSSTASVYLP